MTVLKHWLAAWEELRLRGSPHDEFEEVVRRLSVPSRLYHNLKHVDYCLGKFLELPRMGFPGALIVSIVLEDIELSVHPDEYQWNKERSAEYATDMLLRYGGASDAVATVEACILTTKHHGHPLTFEGRYITDVDHAALADGPHTFDRDQDLIRREFATVPDHVFYPERLRTFTGLLGSKHIFHDKGFRERYEVQAKDNLRRYIARPELQKYLTH